MRPRIFTPAGLALPSTEYGYALVKRLCEAKEIKPDMELLMSSDHLCPDAAKDNKDLINKHKFAKALADEDGRKGRARGSTEHKTPECYKLLIPLAGKLPGCYLVE